MNIFSVILTSCLLAFLSLSPSLEATDLPVDFSQKAKPPTIKILLAQDEKKALIEVKGRYFIYNPDNELLISSSHSGRLDWMTCTDQGICWGGNFPAVFQMRIVPGDSQSTILVNGIQYKGCLDVYTTDQSLNIINEVDVENYLKSLLSASFPQILNPEVMDAVAIVARTHACYHIERSPYALWHVKAEDVGYQGHALTAQNVQIDRAIQNTQQMILTFHNAPFATTWTENSAGKTADFGTIFRKKALVPRGVGAPLAAKDREKSAWSFQISKQHLAKALELPMIKNAELYSDKESQKIYGIKIHDGKTTKHLTFFELQKILGAKKLRSNDFQLRQKGDKIIFEGFGEGPGVGLCLYSAQIMAQHGEKAPKILSSFFPETKLVSTRNWKLGEVKEKN